MTKVTQLPIITNVNNGITILVVDDKQAKKVAYDTLVTSVAQNAVNTGLIARGFVGSRGFTGSQGIPGEFAAMGYTGSRGFVGYVGSIGFAGSVGFVGSASTVTGYAGSVGYIGSASTATGFHGSVGFTGSQGGVGYAGSASTATGFTGSAGGNIPVGGTTGQSLVKLSNTNFDVGWGSISGGGSGTAVLPPRTVMSTSSGNILPNVTATFIINTFKTFVLSQITTSFPAWVRLYASNASRNADLSRNEFTDPSPGSGIIAEVITVAGNLTQLITPGIIGFNADSPASTTTYVSIVNKDSLTRNISVSLTVLQLEGN